MITISLRVDEILKEQAEQVAAELGTSLSSAVNMFLRKFVMEGGFPFALKIDNKRLSNLNLQTFTTEAAIAAAQSAISSSDSEQTLPAITYFDSVTNKFVKL